MKNKLKTSTRPAVKTTSLPIKRFRNLEDALNAASSDERTAHADAKRYNLREYNLKMECTAGRASEIYVVEGKIYYTFELSGSEKGMTLLNRLETFGSCMNNEPFYKVTLHDDTLEIQEDLRAAAEGKGIKAMPFSRSMEARGKYAENGFMMTTDFDLVFAYLRHVQNSIRQEISYLQNKLAAAQR